MKRLKLFMAILLLLMSLLQVFPLQNVDAASIDINSKDLYAIDGNSNLAQISDASLINNSFQIVRTTVVVNGKNNNISAYDGNLIVVQAAGKLNYLDQIHPDGSLTSFLYGSYPRKYVLYAVAITRNKDLIGFCVNNNRKPILQMIDSKGVIQEKKVTFSDPNDAGKLTMNGDAAIDGEGNFWKVSYTNDGKKAYLQVIDFKGPNARVKKTIELFDKTQAIKMNFGGLAFLSDGNMVVSGNSSAYKVDLSTGRITLIGSGFDTYDLASSHTPVLKPQPQIELTSNPATNNDRLGSVYQRKEIEYIVKITNKGNLATSNSKLTQSILPENTEYIKGSTTLNGKIVSDNNGKSPLLQGMLVHSPGSAEGIIGVKEPAILKFKVRVNKEAPPRSLIENGGVTLKWEDVATNLTELTSNTLSHRIEKNKTSIEVADSTITLGSEWDPKDNFVSATDIDGTPIDFNHPKIQVQGNVDTTKAGNYSLPYVNDDIEKTFTVHVVPPLQFTRIPEVLPFGTIKGGTKEQLIPIQDENWAIEIDNRIAKDWQVTAEATPIQDEDQNVYTNALIYKGKNGEESDLANGQQIIATGTGEEIRPMIYWSKDQGLLFRYNPAKMKKGSYRATVTFTLIDHIS